MSLRRNLSDRAAPDARALRSLAYPTEATTKNGTLVTVETFEPGDGGDILGGWLWPLGQKRIRASWRSDGHATTGVHDNDIAPGSSELNDILAEIARVRSAAGAK